MKCNLAVGRVFYGKDHLSENLATTSKVAPLLGRLGVGEYQTLSEYLRGRPVRNGNSTRTGVRGSPGERVGSAD